MTEFDMAPINERLLDEIKNAIKQYCAESVEAGEPVDKINAALQGKVGEFEAWRLQSYRGIKQHVDDYVSATIESRTATRH
jgi:hypothetical protein